MKILIHTDEYYPTCAACAYRMKVFVDVFSEKGNEVTVIASSTNKGNGDLGECREKIIFAPTIPMKKKTTLMRMLNNLSFAFTSVFASLLAGKADIVLTTSPPPLVSISGWLIAKLKGAKLVYDVRDIWPEVAIEMNHFSEDSFFCRVFNGITDFMYKHADLITTVSPGKIRKIQNKLPANMREKVLMVGNGFDEQILNFKLDPAVTDKYGLEDKFTCVYIGNIGLAQGLNVLLEVAAKTRHKNVQFLLFGSGAEKQALAQRAEELGLENLRFCGVIPHEMVFTLLTKSHISFVPLKTSDMKDSVPTKVYEALGVGCPVLLVAEGDSCDILKETGFGRCVSPDRPEELLCVFDDMVEHYSDICKNRLQSMNLMKEKYSRQQIASEFEMHLQEILNNTGGSKT